MVENAFLSQPTSNISRIKSLIKPPPPRSSWELLLKDYLEDPSPQPTFTPDSSPSPNPLPIPIKEKSIPSPYPPSSFTERSTLPPRRYQMILDELVYLISQVGRADLYREMVQYIKTQNSAKDFSPSSPSNGGDGLIENLQRPTTEKHSHSHPHHRSP